MNMPLQVLIVDDSIDDALLIEKALRHGGFDPDIRRVETADQMQRALRERPWDVVLADYTMPRFSTPAALKLLQGQGLDVPFIVVSGTIGEERAVEVMRAGAMDYIMKERLSLLAPAVRRELREARERRTRREMEGQLRNLSRAIEQSASSVFITDSEGNIEYVNPAFESLTGYAKRDAVGGSPSLLRSDKHDDRFFADMWSTLRRGDVFQGVVVNRKKNGALFYEEKTITPIKDSDGAISHFVSTGMDITTRIHAEEERSRLAAVLEATTDFVAVLDVHGRMLHLNKAARRLWGLGEDEDCSRLSIRDAYAEWAARQILGQALPAAVREGVWSGECTLVDTKGREIPVSQVFIAHYDHDGNVQFVSTIARDMSEQKRLQEQLIYQASHDALTGVANRAILHDRLHQALSQARRRGRRAAVLFLDLDRFKRINDTLGHHVGDELLSTVASRIKGLVRQNDTIGRHGGDEFVIIMDEVGGKDDLAVVAKKLRQVFSRPIDIEGQEITLTCSIGIAVFPDDGPDSETLLRRADAAMYRAKEQGRNIWAFYSDEVNGRAQGLLSLEADLGKALQQQQFVLHYQPQVDLDSGRIRGLEALLRWQHPRRGMVSPSQFVPLLEEMGLIGAVGEWVLNSVCSQLCRWQEQGHALVPVSVNVSGIQFRDEGVVETVSAALRNFGIAPELLEVEITESVIMRDDPATIGMLHALGDIGVRLAVDDFGTGHSSLAYLKRFPIDTLKLDYSFVQDVDSDEGAAAIATAIIALGRSLNLRVVAEGVETQAQASFMREQGCHLGQGFLFHRPLPADQVAALIPATPERKARSQTL